MACSDPLNWNSNYKFFVLIQVSIVSMLSPFTQAFIVNKAPALYGSEFSRFWSHVLTIYLLELGLRRTCQGSRYNHPRGIILSHYCDRHIGRVSSHLVPVVQCVWPSSHLYFRVNPWHCGTCGVWGSSNVGWDPCCKGHHGNWNKCGIRNWLCGCRRHVFHASEREVGIQL